MTEEDAIKKVVADVLDERAQETARKRRIAGDRADFESFLKDVSSRKEPPLNQETRSPVTVQEVTLPVLEIAQQTNEGPGGSPPLAVEYRRVLVCLEDGVTAEVVELMVKPA